MSRALGILLISLFLTGNSHARSLLLEEFVEELSQIPGEYTGTTEPGESCKLRIHHQKLEGGNDLYHLRLSVGDSAKLPLIVIDRLKAKTNQVDREWYDAKSDGNRLSVTYLDRYYGAFRIYLQRGDKGKLASATVLQSRVASGQNAKTTCTF